MSFWQCPDCHNIFCEQHAILHQCDRKLTQIPQEIITANTTCLVCKWKVKMA